MVIVETSLFTLTSSCFHVIKLLSVNAIQTFHILIHFNVAHFPP